MERLDRLAQALMRRRRDVWDSEDDCSDVSVFDFRECRCKQGDDFWCEDSSIPETAAQLSAMVIIIIIAAVAILISVCVCCACYRRRHRGAVFRTPSGRTVTTTTTAVAHPPTAQAAGAVANTSYPTQSQVWVPTQQGGVPQPPAGYTPLQPQSDYPQPQGGYPQAQGGYPQAQGGYPQPQSGYPQPQSDYPQPQSGYPQPQGGYPQTQGGYPQPQSGYPQTQSGYPQTQGDYPQPQPGFVQAPPQHDLPPPYEAAADRQQPFNPNFVDAGDTKRPL